jgi:hypothetical protein
MLLGSEWASVTYKSSAGNEAYFGRSGGLHRIYESEKATVWLCSTLTEKAELQGKRLFSPATVSSRKNRRKRLQPKLFNFFYSVQQGQIIGGSCILAKLQKKDIIIYLKLRLLKAT